jgi:6-phosphogluconolactonase
MPPLITRFTVVRYADDTILANAVAERWISELRARPPGGGNYSVALSGGRIARRLCSAVAALAGANLNWLDGVHFFWGDERCVPADDPESNFGLANSLMLKPLRIPLDRIHRVRGEDSPDAAAKAAASDLCQFTSLAANGQPILDLVFLGMGEDGHIASLFPPEPLTTLTDPTVFRAVTASKPPPRRITLGYPALIAARQVWVLASGEGKSDALRESISAGGQTPLARLLNRRDATLILTDIGEWK